MIGRSPAIQVIDGGGAGGPLVLDHFTDGDGTALASHTPDTNGAGNPWAAISGTWTIQANRAQCAGVAENVAVIDSAQADVTVQATMTTGGGHQGLAWRVSDPSNRWFWGDGQVWTKIAGAESAVMAAANATAGDIFKVVTSGTTHTGYVNGVQNWQLTGQSFNATATSHGLYDDGHTVSFDDFQVTHP